MEGTQAASWVKAKLPKLQRQLVSSALTCCLPKPHWQKNHILCLNPEKMRKRNCSGTMSINFTLFQAPFSDFRIQQTFSVSDVWRKRKFVEAVSTTLNPTAPLQRQSADATHQQEPQTRGSSTRHVAGDGEGIDGAAASCSYVQSTTMLYVTGQERGDFIQLQLCCLSSPSE